MTTTDDTQQDAVDPQTPAEPPEPAAEGEDTGDEEQDPDDDHPTAKEASKWASQVSPVGGRAPGPR